MVVVVVREVLLVVMREVLLVVVVVEVGSAHTTLD